MTSPSFLASTAHGFYSPGDKGTDLQVLCLQASKEKPPNVDAGETLAREGLSLQGRALVPMCTN